VTILSLTAIARLAERRCRQADQPVPLTDLLAWLTDLEVETGQAQAGVRLATIVGRLETVEDDERRPCLRIPNVTEAAA
jgi:hypothetical protein